MITYSENINVPIAVVWQYFIHKIEHPENFVPGVSNVSIKEHTDQYIIREMDIEANGGSKVRFTEKITYTPYCVKFLILDHPTYSGYVDNIAERISDNETKITFTLNWIDKETATPFNNQEMIKNAVRKTVDFILHSK
jgi:ribosome-associated toxin RatA of RatAB toxin-antitoxin module